MRVLACLLCVTAAVAAVPFWEAKPPAEWSDTQLKELLTDSPWAQEAISGKSSSGAQVYLASAHPVREAEAEAEQRAARERKTPPPEDPTADEYADFLRENDGKVIVLAVAVSSPKMLQDPAEVKRMEEECVLKIGKRKYKMTGHFPPSPTDALLRLVFPRAVTEADRSLRFELYIPSAPDPYRFAEFRIKELTYKGRPEM